MRPAAAGASGRLYHDRAFQRRRRWLTGKPRFRRRDCAATRMDDPRGAHLRDGRLLPPGLPSMLAPQVGDFLGLLANRKSNAVAESLLRLAATYVAPFAVTALKIYLGLERFFGHLLRSDHAPFWEAGLLAVMWTDTAEFRNPHYHLPSDTPDTLDYEFLANVTRLALARAVSWERQESAS